MTKLEDYQERFAAAQGVASEYKSHFEQIYGMFMPNKDNYDTKNESRGGIKNIRLYDTEGVIALEKHVAQMHIGLTPIGQRWAELSAGSQVPVASQDQFNREAQEATEILFNYIDASNFHLTANEAYYELGVGTGAIVINEGPDENPFICSAVKLPFYYPEEGPNGTIETVWRKFENFSYRNILRTWPRAKIPQIMQESAKDAPTYKIDLQEGTVFDEKTGAYEYILWHDESKEVLLSEMVLSSPWVVFRSSKRANELYGRGPADRALPTMQSLNQIYEDKLRAGAFRSMPIYLGVNDGVFNPWTTNLEPNTIIPVSPFGSNPPLTPVPQGGNPEYAVEDIMDLRKQINNIFMTDPLGSIEDPAKTATEIMIRNQAALELKIPSISRLQVELLDKVIQRFVFILKKKGLFPPLKVDGKEFAIEYKSPLIQAQDQADATNIVKYVQTLQSTVGPDKALIPLDEPDFYLELANKMNVPLKVLKSAVEIEQTLDQMAQAEQEQNQPQLPQAPVGGLQ